MNKELRIALYNDITQFFLYEHAKHDEEGGLIALNPIERAKYIDHKSYHVKCDL
jgi:hypothetical protein